MSILNFPVRDTDLCSSDEDSDEDMENWCILITRMIMMMVIMSILMRIAVFRKICHMTLTKISVLVMDHTWNSVGEMRCMPSKMNSHGHWKEIHLFTGFAIGCVFQVLSDSWLSNVPHVKYHFVGTTLIINASCQSGHDVSFLLVAWGEWHVC